MVPHEGPGSDQARERFELERFSWIAPDRLQLCGRFTGLRRAPMVPRELVVQGDGGEQRLPAAPDSETDSPQEGRRWRVDFRWEDTPIAFDSATLVFGDEMRVVLPK